MKFKATAALLIFSLVLLGALPSSLAGKFTGKASAQTMDGLPKVKDIGPKLRHQAEDEDFKKKFKKSLKDAAEELSEDGDKANSESTEGDSNENGGSTKYFLSLDNKGSVSGGYSLEPYTKRGEGENVVVYVAQNIDWPADQDRPTLQITQEQVNALITEFDSNIYPKETEFFGSPVEHTGASALFDDVLRNSGLDVPTDYYKGEDGKVMLLIDNFQDVSYYDPTYPFYIAGFYSSLYELYFDRNIVNIDAANIVRSTGSYGTLAHEFQHLIHDDNDSNEVTWLNEGMSDLAEYLVGYGHPEGHIQYFLNHPENSLVTWDEYLNSPTGPETLADYGQAYLLEYYLLKHYGKSFIQDLAKDKANGIASVNDALSDENTGINFEELFRRFSIALTVDSPEPGNGIYNFEDLDLQVNYRSAEDTDKEGVPAWGADYIELNPGNKIRQITFDGVKFLPTPWDVVSDPSESGGHGQVLYSNQGNKLDNRLILKADLTEVEEATLNFDTYYNIEKGWDFAVVQVSTDGGNTWTTLSNEDTTSKHAEGALDYVTNHIPGFTGTSNGWTEESFDLSSYAGQEVLVSFRYLTDPAAVYPGWYIDNVEIPEIGFSNDGSSLDAFSSLAEILQESTIKYAVSFVHEKTSGQDEDKHHYQVLNVEPFDVTEAEAQSIKEFLSGGNTYMIVWHPTGPESTDPVPYSYNILTNGDLHKMKNKKEDSND
ncbi:MAG TPA: choice-of-anchor J domain-containing protein [Bacillales bacterium]|nr:choice-of-anchor J domain-containing protein [Bacillales bacterium]